MFKVDILNMKGLILAGGTGSRLRPITYTSNKHLIPIANRPMLYYVVENLRSAGISEIGVILGNNDPESVKKYLGDGSKFNVKITYIFQGEPRGIAHAVYCAKDFTKDSPFIVHLGDNLLKNGILGLIEDFNKTKPESVVAVCPVKNPERFGVAEIDKNGKILKFVEKPKNPTSNLALVGVYIFRPTIYDVINRLKPSWRNELEITEAIDSVLQEGKVIKIHIIKGWWKDTGKPEDILEANRLVLEDMKPENDGKIENDTEINGRVSIGENSIIKTGTVIKGPVAIGKNCNIGPNTYIGPYTAVGDNTIIEEGNIEDSIIIGNTIIKVKEKIVDSIIGENCEVIETSKLPKGHRFIIGQSSRIHF